MLDVYPRNVERPIKLIVFHGPECRYKFELLAWLRGPDVKANAITVSELPPDTEGHIDDRVDLAIAWADRAIALVTPDSRSPSGALNVIDEIARWRTSKSADTLAIVRQKDCKDMWSNLDGVVRIEFEMNRINETFISLLRFLRITPGAPIPKLRSDVSIGQIVMCWLDRRRRHPSINIIIGGCDKYDPGRVALGLKTYQSTEPVRGVSELVAALTVGNPQLIVHTTCDYENERRNYTGNLQDLVVVGAGDTNRVAREIFSDDVIDLPVHFEPPMVSGKIVAVGAPQNWTAGDHGLILSLSRPHELADRVLVCAGIRARGTIAALLALAFWLRNPEICNSLNFTGCIVRLEHAFKPIVEWPFHLG